MADNIVVNAGSGGPTIGTDVIGGVHHPLSKIEFGADGSATMVSADNPLPTAVAPNFGPVLFESFETYSAGTTWTETKDTNDLVFLDGNAASASYLVISKSPFETDTTTTVDSMVSFPIPFEVSVGVHSSQRTVGQEMAIELIDTDNPTPPLTDLAIVSVTQTTTVLTVTTVLAHGLVPGQSIGIRAVPDSRANYPALVVATIVSPTQFTATAGPMGTIPSLTINTNNLGGFVYFRPRLSRRSNGVSQVFENATTTNGSFYVRTANGDVLPSGTINGSHSSTVSTTASALLTNLAYTRSFNPTTEYRLSLQPDRLQWTDAAMDTTGQPSVRHTRTQVLPNPTKKYQLRFRATNLKSMTVPIAIITSISKVGTTTATVTTATAHGLTTADAVNLYGMRDTTNFPATSATVASVINSTQFTVVVGTASTTSSYGGYVARVQGGNLMSAGGGATVSIQTATLTAGLLTLTLSAAATLSFGDLINVYGCLNASSTSVGIDGVWRVRNIVASTLELEPIGWTAPADFGSTVCGGSLIKRTDFRISFARVFQYDKLRVETSMRGGGDNYNTMPVSVQNSMSLNTNQYVNSQYPQLVTDTASGAITATTTGGTITPAYGASYSVGVVVTAVTGTNPTMDVVIQESDDSGTNWFDVYHFPRITATGAYRSPTLAMLGNRIRYVQTIAGTSPSFTRSINRSTSNRAVAPIRQFIDRTIAVNTLNAVTPTFEVRDAAMNKVMLFVTMAAITTTAPAIQLEGSEDLGATWYAIGAPLTGVASSTVMTSTEHLPGHIRARVSAAGVGATLGHILIKATG